MCFVPNYFCLADSPCDGFVSYARLDLSFKFSKFKQSIRCVLYVHIPVLELLFHNFRSIIALINRSFINVIMLCRSPFFKESSLYQYQLSFLLVLFF